MRLPSRHGAFIRRDGLEISAMIGMRLIAARPLSALAALALIAGVSIAKADDAFVDTHGLPRLEGAIEDPARSGELSYSVPGNMTNTLAATRRLLMADGW